jgi:hypothetical protein
MFAVIEVVGRSNVMAGAITVKRNKSAAWIFSQI